MDRRGGTRGDVAAIFDIRFGDRKFGSVEGMVVVQLPCRELHGVAAHGDPTNRG
jgi:hypothetical protein